jgi:hypothetical protein
LTPSTPAIALFSLHLPFPNLQFSFSTILNKLNRSRIVATQTNICFLFDTLIARLAHNMSVPSQHPQKRRKQLDLRWPSNSEPKVKSKSVIPRNANRVSATNTASTHLHRRSAASTNSSTTGTTTKGGQSGINIEEAVSSTAFNNLAAKADPSTQSIIPHSGVFKHNVGPPAIRVTIPEIHPRIETTFQLALCIGLLSKDSDTVGQHKDQLLNFTSDAATRIAWINDVRQDPIKQGHIH